MDRKPQTDTSAPRKPFFARLLEAQNLDEVKTGLKAGKPDQTQKAPSDHDEW